MPKSTDFRISDFDIPEIENRLNAIFNGYLGCDTGDSPEEIQSNHYLICCIIEFLKRQ